jgi:hypothetical protein
MSFALHNVRFFTMGNAAYFVGLVALVNALRLVGHREPITVLDLGLTHEQVDMLAEQCELVQLPASIDASNPFALAAHAVHADHEGIAVVVDSDVIVTRNLSDYFALAAEGRVVAFADTPTLARRFSHDWSSIFGLTAPLRAGQPYVNSGLLMIPTVAFPNLLRRWWDSCQAVRDEPTVLDGSRSATAYHDQDALNALLMSEVPEERIAVQTDSAIGYQQLSRVRVENAHDLTCSVQGTTVAWLHYVGPKKPWLSTSWRHLRRTAYTMLLRRLIVGSDVAVKIPLATLPPWLHHGFVGRAALVVAFGVELMLRPVRLVRRKIAPIRRRPTSA